MEKCNNWNGSFQPRCQLPQGHQGECFSVSARALAGEAQHAAGELAWKAYEQSSGLEAIRREVAQQAIQVQDACNLTGVLNSMLDCARKLKELPECQTTMSLNMHPAMQLFADKVYSLTNPSGYERQECFGDAYRRCQELSKEVS